MLFLNYHFLKNILGNYARKLILVSVKKNYKLSIQ